MKFGKREQEYKRMNGIKKGEGELARELKWKVRKARRDADEKTGKQGRNANERKHTGERR